MPFGKKKETAPTQPAKAPRVEPYDIHVMPVKFHQYLSVKRKSKIGLFLLIFFVAVIVVGGIAFGAYYFIGQLSQPPDNSQTNLNQPIVPDINQNSNTPNANTPAPNVNEALNDNANDNVNENQNDNANINVNENQNVNINLNENLNVNINENLNTNVNTSLPEAINYQSSLDSDKDGLTDMEEDLYTTEKRKPDTDEDGY